MSKKAEILLAIREPPASMARRTGPGFRRLLSCAAFPCGACPPWVQQGGQACGGKIGGRTI